jgi:hypothetical protein
MAKKISQYGYKKIRNLTMHKEKFWLKELFKSLKNICWMPNTFLDKFLGVTKVYKIRLFDAYISILLLVPCICFG